MAWTEEDEQKLILLEKKKYAEFKKANKIAAVKFLRDAADDMETREDLKTTFELKSLPSAGNPERFIGKVLTITTLN